MILCCNGIMLIGQFLYKFVIVFIYKFSGLDWKEFKLFYFCFQGKVFYFDVGVFRVFINWMIFVEYIVSLMYLFFGLFDGVVIVFKDIIECKKIEEKLYYLV